MTKEKEELYRQLIKQLKAEAEQVAVTLQTVINSIKEDKENPNQGIVKKEDLIDVLGDSLKLIKMAVERKKLEETLNAL